MSDRIEFYKNRSIGERFSVAIDFLKQNWKVLYKNILLGGLPLALIMSFLLARQQTFGNSVRLGTFSSVTDVFLNMALLYFVVILMGLYIYSMTGAILLHYDRNQLTEETGWGDLQSSFLKLAGKTVLISLYVYIPIIIVVAIISAIFGFSVASFSSHSMQALSLFALILLILLFIGVFIALAPSFTMFYFPAYFSGKTVWESIKTAFRLGFKNWGSLFVALLLVGIVYSIVYMIFSVPLQLVSLFSVIGGKSVGYITYFLLAILSAAGTVLTYPIMVIIFAFQYFSIVEKEEGVSLQSQVSDFENL